MKLEICAVWDSCTELFGRPFFVVATGQAVRSFRDEINKPDGNDFAKHPEDFTLYHIGTFYDDTATFDIPATPVQLVRGKDMIEARN